MQPSKRWYRPHCSFPLSPSGAYYSTGFKPVSLLADPDHVRAWPGGVGDTKGGCNYAPTIAPQKAAAGRWGNTVLAWLKHASRGATTAVPHCVLVRSPRVSTGVVALRA
jgi:branched-subunit amino acid aminotransferase/4-amino-4-deoxychorismate lyase